MKKLVLSMVVMLMATFSASAENVSEVWNAIKGWGILNVENSTPAQAAQNGFTTLSAGYVQAPHHSIVESIEEALDVIDSSYLIGENSNGQITVRLYAQPTGSMYDVLMYSYYAMPQNHMLVMMYGTCTENQLNTLKSLAGK